MPPYTHLKSRSPAPQVAACARLPCHDLLCHGLQATFATITAAQEEADVTDISLLNFVVSDGVSMIAPRYVSHSTEDPASLYYAEASAFQREADVGAAALAETAGAAGAQTGAQTASPPPGAGASASSNAASARHSSVTGKMPLR